MNQPEKVRPLPPVGSKVKLDYGPTSPATWLCAGEVRAVIDDRCMVVLRLNRYHLIDRYYWDAARVAFKITKGAAAKRADAAWCETHPIKVDG